MYRIDQAIKKLSRLASSIRAVRNIYHTQPATSEAAVLGLMPQLQDVLGEVQGLSAESLPGKTEKA